MENYYRIPPPTGWLPYLDYTNPGPTDFSSEGEPPTETSTSIVWRPNDGRVPLLTGYGTEFFVPNLTLPTIEMMHMDFSDMHRELPIISTGSIVRTLALSIVMFIGFFGVAYVLGISYLLGKPFVEIGTGFDYQMLGAARFALASGLVSTALIFSRIMSSKKS